MAGKWRGKGGKSAGPQMPQMLEMEFCQSANAFFEYLMDWNSSAPQLEQGFRELLSLRARCMQAYGMPATKGGGGAKAAGGGALTQVSDGGQVNWKGEFIGQLAKLIKRSTTKDEVTFDVQEVEGQTPGRAGGYIATMSCTVLPSGQSYQGQEVQAGKKQAEQAAAKVALQTEFPEAFARLSGMASFAPPAKQGQKRKAADALPPQNQNTSDPGEFKQRLTQAATLLVGRSLEKGEVVYEVTEAEGQYTATVTLQGYDPGTGYQGLPASNKKLAESQAAEAALAALADQLAPVEAAHREKKKAKNQESLAKLKESRAAKTAGVQNAEN